MSLEPIDPEHALELYLSAKENELAQSSLYSHGSRLGHFVRWCDDNDVNNLNDLTGRQLHEFRIWRCDWGDLSKSSEKTQMDTLRVFVKWLETVDAVPQDLHTKVQSPSLTADENTRNVMLAAEAAEQILAHLAKYEYASRMHVTLMLLWHTMMRTGAAHSLDVTDYDPHNQYLSVIHRPETDTPIKNCESGERLVALSDDVCAVLDDWVENQRPDVVDEHGRTPLLASAQGRLSKTSIRQYCYLYTRPCEHTNECPHGREIATCEATSRDSMAKCPDARSPHAIRRGSITHSLKRDMPETAVSDRANVSQEVLDQHYNRRTEREKMEQRRRYLDNL